MIELFKKPAIDWMGKKTIFIVFSVALLVPGALSVVFRGFNPGIDFSGGAMAYVAFKQKPPLDNIRDALAKQGINRDSIIIQDISKPFGAGGGAQQVLIRLPQAAAEGVGGDINVGKIKISAALHSLFAADKTDKTDVNATGSDSLREKLIALDPLVIRTSLGEGTSDQKYKAIATSIVDFRDKTSGGLISNISDIPLRGGPFDDLGDNQKKNLTDTLNQKFYAGNFNIVTIQSVSASVGAELRSKAIYVTLFALLGMLIYVAFRFEWIYGVGAVLAVFHDVMITLGLFSLFQKEIDMTVIAALLTLVGYSMNDTIVIFDRIRENLQLRRRDTLISIVNDSINQTLSRTILTSGLTLIAALALLLFGGPVLNGFAFALVVGIIIGTYSSFAVATPIMVWWKLFSEQRARRSVTTRVSAGTPVKAK